MSFIDKYLVKLISKKIGTDHLGNSYYIGRKKDYLGRAKRYVIYQDSSNESTNVPPLWHAWLHYMIDDVPNGESNFDWQQEHQANLSGTENAYDPSTSPGKKVDLYEKWQPK